MWGELVKESVWKREERRGGKEVKGAETRCRILILSRSHAVLLRNPELERQPACARSFHVILQPRIAKTPTPGVSIPKGYFFFSSSPGLCSPTEYDREGEKTNRETKKRMLPTTGCVLVS